MKVPGFTMPGEGRDPGSLGARILCFLVTWPWSNPTKVEISEHEDVDKNDIYHLQPVETVGQSVGVGMDPQLRLVLETALASFQS